MQTPLTIDPAQGPEAMMRSIEEMIMIVYQQYGWDGTAKTLGSVARGWLVNEPAPAQSPSQRLLKLHRAIAVVPTQSQRKPYRA